jgi:hypothetical protein
LKLSLASSNGGAAKTSLPPGREREKGSPTDTPRSNLASIFCFRRGFPNPYPLREAPRWAAQRETSTENLNVSVRNAATPGGTQPLVEQLCFQVEPYDRHSDAEGVVMDVARIEKHAFPKHEALTNEALSLSIVRKSIRVGY